MQRSKPHSKFYVHQQHRIPEYYDDGIEEEDEEQQFVQTAQYPEEYILDVGQEEECIPKIYKKISKRKSLQQKHKSNYEASYFKSVENEPVTGFIPAMAQEVPTISHTDTILQSYEPMQSLAKISSTQYHECHPRAYKLYSARNLETTADDNSSLSDGDLYSEYDRFVKKAVTKERRRHGESEGASRLSRQHRDIYPLYARRKRSSHRKLSTTSPTASSSRTKHHSLTLAKPSASSSSTRPFTVLTPRYYRPNTATHHTAPPKQPSVLCMPFVCQPDLASVHTRRIPSSQNTKKINSPKTHPNSSEFDFLISQVKELIPKFGHGDRGSLEVDESVSKSTQIPIEFKCSEENQNEEIEKTADEEYFETLKNKLRIPEVTIEMLDEMLKELETETLARTKKDKTNENDNKNEQNNEQQNQKQPDTKNGSSEDNENETKQQQLKDSVSDVNVTSQFSPTLPAVSEMSLRSSEANKTSSNSTVVVDSHQQNNHQFQGHSQHHQCQSNQQHQENRQQRQEYQQCQANQHRQQQSRPPSRQSKCSTTSDGKKKTSTSNKGKDLPPLDINVLTIDSPPISRNQSRPPSRRQKYRDPEAKTVKKLVSPSRRCRSPNKESELSSQASSVTIVITDETSKETVEHKTQELNYPMIPTEKNIAVSVCTRVQTDTEDENGGDDNISEACGECCVGNVKLDDELQHSKSFIIQLIDRALSKELGTNLDTNISKGKVASRSRHITSTKYLKKACSRKKFLTSWKSHDNSKMCQHSSNKSVKSSTRNSQIKDHSITCTNNSSCDKTSRHSDCKMISLSTPAISGSPFSTHGNNYSISKQRQQTDNSKNCSKCYFHHIIPIAEEPPYVQQLKQLRRGHLHHIQQEIKCLENLENIIDSCGCITQEPNRTISTATSNNPCLFSDTCTGHHEFIYENNDHDNN